MLLLTISIFRLVLHLKDLNFVIHLRDLNIMSSEKLETALKKCDLVLTSKKFLEILVVGEKFKQFADHSKVINIHAFEEIIRTALSNNLCYKVHFGQGINKKQIQQLFTLVYDYNAHDFFDFQEIDRYHKKASRLHTHKFNNKNILISDPIQINENDYTAWLQIDDRCIDISDHLTGQHIQGMVLIEAARQMVNSVTEKYLIDRTEEKHRFIADKIQSVFHSFVFPMESLLTLRVRKQKKGFGVNSAFEVGVLFQQFNRITTEINFNYSVLDENYISAKENDQKSAVLERFSNLELVDV